MRQLRPSRCVGQTTLCGQLQRQPASLNLACLDAAADDFKDRNTRLLLETEENASSQRIGTCSALQALRSIAPFSAPSHARRKQEDFHLSHPLLSHFEIPNVSFWRCIDRPLVLCLLLFLLPDSARGQQGGNFTVAPVAPPSPSGSLTFAPQPAPNSTKPPSSRPPTLQPTPVVTQVPSHAPTTAIVATAKGLYRQDFVVPRDKTSNTIVATFYNDTQLLLMGELFAGYTYNFVDQAVAQVEAVCVFDVDGQQGFVRADNVTVNSIDYSCQWTSRETEDLEFLPDAFLDYVTANLNVLTVDMKNLGLPIIEAEVPITRMISSPAPTISHVPSLVPSTAPTSSSPPSESPSLFPSLEPTTAIMPTTAPNFPPFTPVPQLEKERPSAGIISLIVIMSGLAVLGALAAYYFYTKKKQTENAPSTFTVSSMAANSRAGQSLLNLRPSSIYTSNGGDSSEQQQQDMETNVVISPADSLLSNKSMLSAGDSGLGDESGDEMDNTKNLQDEFDEYKDQNLEVLRQNIEGNLTGFEGIMSAAVTNALMGDEEANVETQELIWGCGPDPQGEEIEASVLFEVSDWMKRNESAEAERKRSFMQEILNRMVRSVRFGVLNAEDASRTIHESAALLGLQLAEELPVTTVIISGMRKTTTAEDMKKTLKEFGDIGVAAVASGRRGFGIVRFRRSSYVDLALRRYRSGEIVILDVSIQMKVLMPSGAVDSR